MQFRFIEREVPRAAWIACCKRGVAEIEIHYGKSVESKEDFFVEGAWDGEFAQAGFDQAVTLLGSGGKRRDGTIIFAAPSHFFERLFFLHRDDQLFISNSLAFLLAHSRESLDPSYPHYGQSLYRNFGILERGREIPTKSGHQIRLAYSSNLLVNDQLAVRELAKTALDPFRDFDQYRRFLETSLMNVFENSRDPQRRHPYSRPVVLLSTGYDSTATAVLSKSIGCSHAITFRAARPLDVDHYQAGTDNGIKIARRLGMDCIEIDRLDYLEYERSFPEAEIFATAHFVDLYALSLENYLKPNDLLLTGFRGDIMWNKHLDENQDSGGPGLHEFRLRKGFLHIPLPYLGTQDFRPTECPVTRSLRQIANSDEMSKWSVGGNYDRPIPRRMIEEAGVERGTFATAKKAVAVWFGREPAQDIMTPDSYEDFKNSRPTFAGLEANQAILWAVERLVERYR